MRAAYDVEQIRAAEQPLLARLPEGALMQRAATALARRCAALLGKVYGADVVLLVGSGNNGGDALYAGAALARRGARVVALLAADAVHDEGLAALTEAGGWCRPTGHDDAALLAHADLVVDGLLGIGGRGGLRPPQARLAELVADIDGTVVAVDVPSGVDASTGAVDGVAVRADVTVTFGGLKVGLLVWPGAEHAGLVEVVDIGLELPAPSVAAMDAVDVATAMPAPDGETDKYRRGVVGVVAGSGAYTGAAVLAVGGALAAGAGMVRFAGVEHAAEMVRRAWPEAVVTTVAPGDGRAVLDAGRVQAWVVGSGLGTDEPAARIVDAVLGTDLPVLVDADAITVVARDPARLRGRRAPTVLTPHAGEFARLTGVDRAEVEAHRLDHLRRAVDDLRATILLKGATTLVGDPSGQVRVNTADTPYLATAGSGDVLSGICGALMASGASALDAASAGAFVHGMAGVLAAGRPAVPLSAMDIVRAVPQAWRALRS